MTSLLRWRPARESDIEALKAFECTQPAVKRYPPGRTRPDYHHDRWHEARVEAKIRNLRPPLSPPCFAEVAYDEHGLAAVLAWEALDGMHIVELHQGAIARRLRGKGGGFADEMMQNALDQVTLAALEDGIDRVTVVTLVHEDNHPCQSLLRRFNFRHTAPVENGLQQWSRILLTGYAEQA